MSDLNQVGMNKKQDAMAFFSWLYEFDVKAANQFVAEQRYKIITGNVGPLTSEKLAAMQDGLASGVLCDPYKNSVSKGALNTGDSVAQ